MTEKNRGKQAAKPAEEDSQWVVTRRDFLKFSGTLLAGAAINPFGFLGKEKNATLLNFGMVTDSHYADAKTRGSRYYRESLAKMTECVERLNRRKLDFLIELGDFKDMNQPPSREKTLRYLRTIEAVFQKFKGPHYHVLGNHDTDSISKQDFLNTITNTGIPRSAKYYAFSRGGIRFVVLDANYRQDGTDFDRGNFGKRDTQVPEAERAWLKGELAAAKGPVIVFIHQPLFWKRPCVKNAPVVREILEKSGKVLAVFQGHMHSGGYSLVNGIHYYTLKAMVEGSGPENNAYAEVAVQKNGDIVVTGYQKAVSQTCLHERKM